MAIINIPSSWSPIAAGIDVFVKDRLARQQRERQAEQDAWNREARGRQRQNWGYIDQERAYQQQQREKAAQAQAEQDAKALAAETRTQELSSQFTERDPRMAYTGIVPGYTGYGTGDDEFAGTQIDPRIATFSEQQNSLARTLARHPGAPKPTGAAYKAMLSGEQTVWTNQQIAEGIRALEDPQISDAMKVEIARQFQTQNITPTIINQVLGPKAAKIVHEAMSVYNPDYMAVADALHDPNAMYTAESGFGVGDESVEEAGGEQGDYSRTQQRYTPQDKLALHQRFYGKPASPSQSEAYYKGPKAEKQAKIVPMKSWLRAYTSNKRDDFTLDAIDGPIAQVMKDALLAAVGNDAGKADLATISGLFSKAQQEELMGNMWQAAQLIQRQYAPDQSVELIFEDMYRSIGAGGKKLDVIDVSESISPFVEGGGIGNILNDTEASYSTTPRIYNPQQMVQDYLKSEAGIAQLIQSRNI